MKTRTLEWKYSSKEQVFLEILAIFQSNFTLQDDLIANIWYIAWSDNFHIGFKNLIDFAVVIWGSSKPAS